MSWGAAGYFAYCLACGFFVVGLGYGTATDYTVGKPVRVLVSLGLWATGGGLILRTIAAIIEAMP